MSYCATCDGQIVGGPALGWRHAGPDEQGHGVTADADHAAVRAVRIGDSVTHRVAGTLGTVTATARQLTPFDGDLAPWVLVDFVDGLTCWVSASGVEPC